MATTADSEDQTPPPPATQAGDSPPLPQKHVQVAPGPRATRFKDLYAQALNHTLSRLAYDNLAGCYPTVAARNGPVLEQIRAQMARKLDDKCRAEFESILASRAVVPKLNELEGLVAEAAARRRRRSRGDAGDEEEPTPPHTLPPEQILAAHLTPALAAHQSQLNARLQTTQSQNSLLHDEVRRQRDEIDELVARLEAAAADVRGANVALGEVVEQLAREAREGKAAVEAAEGDMR